MSDTPRTDNQVIDATGWDEWCGVEVNGYVDFDIVPAEICRRIERDLNAAKKELSILLPNIQKLMADLANAEATINNMKSATMEQTAAAVIIGEPK